MARSTYGILTTGIIATLFLSATGYGQCCSEPGYDESLAANDIAGEFYGNINFVSNYLADGVSATDNKPAIQGELGFRVPFGFYVGVRGSNIIVDNSTNANFEAQAVLGWASEKNNILWNVDVTYYIYPNSGNVDYDYWEAHGKLGYRYNCLTANVGLGYADNYYNIAGTYLSPYIDTELKLQYGVAVFGQIARVYFQKNTKYGVPDYNHWNVGVKKSFFDWLDVSASYFGTDIRKSECFAFGGTGEKICGSGLLLGLGHEF